MVLSLHDTPAGHGPAGVEQGCQGVSNGVVRGSGNGAGAVPGVCQSSGLQNPNQVHSRAKGRMQVVYIKTSLKLPPESMDSLNDMVSPLPSVKVCVTASPWCT